jgi:hypothetical protein
MGAKTTAYADSLLALIFNATTFANVAINATSSPLTNLYVSLHTASPGTSGNQTTNEAAYTNYARVAVARTSSGWTVSGDSVVPVATIQFPQAGTMGSSETETYFGVGSSSSGSGNLYYFGTITPNIVVNTNVTPELTTASTIIES